MNVNIIQQIWAVIAKVTNDSFTSANGDYDPARVVGYGIVIIGAVEYLALQAYSVVRTGVFDSASFATGLAGIGVALVAAAGGVWIKKSTEIPVKEETPST